MGIIYSVVVSSVTSFSSPVISASPLSVVATVSLRFLDFYNMSLIQVFLQELGMAVQTYTMQVNRIQLSQGWDNKPTTDALAAAAARLSGDRLRYDAMLPQGHCLF